MGDAERDIELSTRRIGEIAQDIARLRPTTGDAFTMVVLGQEYTERKEAGRALMKEILTLLQLQRQGEVHLATIGGFDLVYEGERFVKSKSDGYRYETLLQRTGADYEIDLAITVTPLGAISRPTTHSVASTRNSTSIAGGSKMPSGDWFPTVPETEALSRSQTT